MYLLKSKLCGSRTSCVMITLLEKDYLGIPGICGKFYDIIWMKSITFTCSQNRLPINDQFSESQLGKVKPSAGEFTDMVMPFTFGGKSGPWELFADVWRKTKIKSKKVKYKHSDESGLLLLSYKVMLSTKIAVELTEGSIQTTCDWGQRFFFFFFFFVLQLMKLTASKCQQRHEECRDRRTSVCLMHFPWSHYS